MYDNVYAMDFETTTDVDYEIDGYVRCYLWHIRGLDGSEVAIGYDMESWFEWFESLKKDSECWFWNTSFDCSFISYHGLSIGYTSESFEEISQRKKKRKDAVKLYLDENDLPAYHVMPGGKRKATYIPKHVTKAYEVPKRSMTLIKAGSKWITFVLVNSRGAVLKVMDAGNKYSGGINSLDDMAKAIGEPSKSFLDVLKRRDPDYVATEEDIERVKGDTRILAKGMSYFYDWGMTAATLAGDAWKIYRQMMYEQFGKDVFEKVLFPQIPQMMEFKDGTIVEYRRAYQGGRVYLNPEWKDKDVDEATCIDVNSEYPYILYSKKLPYGRPYGSVDAPCEELYIVQFTNGFKLKKGKMPTYQRSGSFRNVDAEWVKESNGMEELVMTNLDLEVFLEHYDLESPFEACERHYVNFKSRDDMFKGYVDRFTAEKIDSKKKRDVYDEDTDEWKKYNMLYLRAKMLLNSLYGKFGQDPVKPYQWLVLDDGRVRVLESNAKEGEYFEPRDSKYLPVAIFVTSYGRKMILEASEKFGADFMYCDTDSVWYRDRGQNLEEMDIEVNKTKLGAWDKEHTTVPWKGIRAKTYCYEENGKLVVKCGGMPANVKKQVTWENFKEGAEFDGKLMPRMVPGGKVLKPCTYVIKKG